VVVINGLPIMVESREVFWYQHILVAVFLLADLLSCNFLYMWLCCIKVICDIIIEVYKYVYHEFLSDK